MTNAEIAKVFKALCDERRIEILKLLVSGEKCACSLLEELNISQPTLSHHMKILCESAMVSSRKDGKWTHYKINPEGCKIANEMFISLTTEILEGDCSDCCEK